MNTNIQNQSFKAMETLVMGINRTEFYSTILTRSKVAGIYDTNIKLIKSLPLTDEQVIRTLIVECLRYVNMVVQDLSVLLVYGLNNITRLDLDLPEHKLVQKLAVENEDVNVLDVLNRILGQINSKLPFDLRERLTPLLKVALLQRLHKLLPVGENLSVVSKNIVETFDHTDNVKRNTSQDNNYMKGLTETIGEGNLTTLRKQGYNLKDISKHMINMRINEGTYEEQLAKLDDSSNNKITKDTVKQNILHSNYVDKDPTLYMDAKSKELYYYDEHSGSLVSTNDVKVVNGETMSKGDFEKLLKEHNLTSKEINTLLKEIKTGKSNTKADAKDDTKDNAKSSFMKTYKLHIIVGVISVILIILILYQLMK